jgi:sugar phosphate permease
MGKYAKAIVGALVAGLTALVPSFDGGVTAAEWTTAVVAFLVALGVVWAVPNAPAEPTR